MLGPTAAGNAPAGIGHAEPISRATARRPARARSAMWSMRPQRLTKDRRQKAHTGYRGLAIPLGRPGARWSGSRASQSSLAVPLVRPRTRSGRDHHHVDLGPTAINTLLRGSGVMWLTGWVDFLAA